jgi:5-methylcytosine-specific restriction endonuclease McrA
LVARSTTTRDRHRRIIRRGEPPCAYQRCLYPGVPIDYRTTNHLDPLSYTVDHIIPLNKGGTDELDNKAPMHRACNRDKSDKHGDDQPKAGPAFVTHRNWWTKAG